MTYKISQIMIFLANFRLVLIAGLWFLFLRAFIECSAKDQTHLRTIVEEAVLISFDEWFQKNFSSLKSSKLVNCNQKVERKWSLAAQLSSSFPMHSWSNISNSREKSVDNVVGKSPVNISSKNVSQGAGKANTSQLTCERNSSPHLTTR